MKKVILASMCIIASIVLFSCTNEAVETTPNNVKQQISANDGTGQVPIPKPKR